MVNTYMFNNTDQVTKVDDTMQQKNTFLIFVVYSIPKKGF